MMDNHEFTKWNKNTVTTGLQTLPTLNVKSSQEDGAENMNTTGAAHQLGNLVSSVKPSSVHHHSSRSSRRMDTNTMPQPRLYFSIHTHLSVAL
jgi:hypothetical protein